MACIWTALHKIQTFSTTCSHWAIHTHIHTLFVVNQWALWPPPAGKASVLLKVMMTDTEGSSNWEPTSNRMNPFAMSRSRLYWPLASISGDSAPLLNFCCEMCENVLVQPVSDHLTIRCPATFTCASDPSRYPSKSCWISALKDLTLVLYSDILLAYLRINKLFFPGN